MQEATRNVTLDDKCREFAALLGLEGAVPPEVLRAAVEDHSYAHNLLVCRNEPALLNVLLSSPPRPRPSAVAAPAPVEHTNMGLVGRAGKALFVWAKTGFSVVDMETLERREKACLECPNLTEPRKLLQKLASSEAADSTGRRTGGKVCRLCGCNVGRKMRLPSDACPDQHPTRLGFTRWGEPVKAASPAPSA